MISVKYYEVELDIEAFYRTESGLFIERVGSEGELIPLHGKILSTPIKSKFKKGDVAYFHHHNLKNRLDKTTNIKTTLPIIEGDIIAVKRKGKWLQGAMIPAKRIKKPVENYLAYEKQDGYESHRFEVDGEIIWIFTDSDYMFAYEPEMSFLRPQYITFNETKNESQNDFVIVERLDENIGYVQSGGILIPEKLTKQKGKGTVIKPNKYKISGTLAYRKSNHQSTPITGYDNVAAIQFNSIQSCYEKD
tara:strand:+ start:2733 stop:3476 length:744 start_codon:yes stop_codon:yes gene_type:complete